jgi:ribosome maturation factor RimP
MTAAEYIEQKLEEKFREPEFDSCFCVEVKEVQKGRKIEVYIDCDTGVDFSTCRQISRYLEEDLDESPLVKENYILEVSSPGARRPLKLLRQYGKHVGRKLEIKLTDGEKLEGRLLDVLTKSIVLERRIVEKEGKKKIRKKIESEIDFSAIEKAKVKLAI